jgi:hypothetical protein
MPFLPAVLPRLDRQRRSGNHVFRFARDDIVPGDVSYIGIVPFEARLLRHLPKCIPVVHTTSSVGASLLGCLSIRAEAEAKASVAG